MRRYILLAVILIALPGVLMAQSAIDQLSGDMQILFDELGKDIMPNLQTAAVLNHELGSAELGNFPHMYFSLSVGATVGSDNLGYLAEDFKGRDRFANYELFNEFIDESGIRDEDAFDVLQDYLPYPSVRAVFGLGLMRGYEVVLQYVGVPQVAQDAADVDGLDAGLNHFGFRVRKVLTPLARDPRIPAISVGAGYLYSGFNLTYSLDEVDPLDLGSDSTLKVEGDATFEAVTHSFGGDMRVSGRFLRVFYPFIGTTIYAQRSMYRAGIDDFSGTIEIADQETSVVPAVEPLSDQQFNGTNVVMNAGFDLKLLIFNMFVHGNYSFTSQAPGAVVGLRLQF